MKKITGLTILFSLLASSFIFGQQDPQYTQYNYNMNVINPAYAGSRGTLSIGVLARTQWVGIEGAPKTATFSVNAPMGNSVGVGLSVISDQIGPVDETNLYGDFSYTLTTSENGRLALGLKAGFTFQNIGLLSLTTIDPNDPLFVENVNNTYPNFGVGAFYYTNRFYAGLSVPNMLKSRHFNRSKGIISSASEKMHYFVTSGYVFDVSNTLKFKPSIMLKGVNGSPLSVDLSGNLLFNEKVEFGVSYRFDDSVDALVNFSISPSLRIGYAYDYTLSNLGNYNYGTHEIFLLFDIDLNRNSLKSPRFF